MKYYHQYINEPWKKIVFWGLLLLIVGFLLFIIGGLIGYSISSDQSAFNFLNPASWNHVFSFIR
ncbi:DNA-directed RNA polymerase subunit beta [Aerococcus urinaeequi]|uniref:DNA-directed RNA polymerase subunit beta n=1 Tax=Aerococcus urinaeequi TaxID=51665 RepID=A0AA47G9G5_9LACT|nr:MULTISPECIES: DNA-directed RNA polymerase subunit beta [Lactobacillales]KAF3300568.1 DNA-directed RNA polymerase subunit beta [Carnobacterium sp. PL12RED10]KAF3303642.1 DNA-directed RNA polymerase subunit beta [Carnobacterium sp. PL26RED25]KAF3306772.1 DNA-directed RNA polymerase subunit beta [Carnobacterium sp. PL17GRE32]KAF3307160.1 DNA-directed RNA polymerase subunit beta [Carnobacterium sp. PL24RED07]MBR2129489.1 DNA-directed RNA polymerase subunit beta [Aerococcus sp.]